MRGVADGMERFLQALAEQVPELRRQTTESTVILIFKDDACYEPFTLHRDGVAVSIPGYFLAGRDLNFITAVAAGNQTQRVVNHELFHALYHTQEDYPLPAWASEGLADFYSTFDKTFGEPIPSHVNLLRTGSWIPLAGLLAATRESSFYRQTELKERFYAESWLLVHYLLDGNGGGKRPELFRYLSLRAGRRPIEASVADAFQSSLDELESDLRRYLLSFRLGNRRPRSPAALVRAAADGIEVWQISDSEEATYRGDLLLHLDRLEAAEQQLERALNLEPVFPGAFTAMGSLRLRQNRNVEALHFLERAVGEDASNPIAHFQFAVALETAASKEPADARKQRLELSRAHFLRTIELAPWFAEAYQWLGYVAIALEDGYDDAEAALHSAIARYPHRMDLRETLAVVKNAKAAHLERERSRRERESREHLAAALDTLRLSPPPAAVDFTATQTSYASDLEVPAPNAGIIAHPTYAGLLTMIDCRDGLTLILRKGDEFIRFHTKTPSHLEFISKTSNAADEAACGLVRPEHRVIVTYLRKPIGNSRGEPVRIEYR